MSIGSSIPLLHRAMGHGARTAVEDRERSWTYEQLVDRARAIAARLLDHEDDLSETRIGYLVAPGGHHIATQWGIWLAGGIAVPMCAAHPRPELEHVVTDAGVAALVADASSHDVLSDLADAHGIDRFRVDELTAAPRDRLPDVTPDRRALILYTSGTTGRPKGVVSTHRNLEAQIRCLVDAWAWRPDDAILHALPLHHVHGIVNAACCALWTGARCEMLPAFDAATVWSRLASGDISLFMGVPTMYAKLIRAHREAPDALRVAWSTGSAGLRLMVSGSAALPVSVLQEWQEITGHTLLERYGMTEIGMALSNPLHGERRAGHVGVPLPTVDVRLDAPAADEPGEIQVRGPSVFLEYWNHPDATEASFVDGWFRTGDMATIQDGSYRILGRASVDILKTGGYKVSALEIEEVLREHPDILEVAVVGLDDEEWGQRVAAAIVLAEGRDLDPVGLRAWSADRLARYKVPSRWLALEELPRNALGKVQKPRVVEAFATGT